MLRKAGQRKIIVILIPRGLCAVLLAFGEPPVHSSVIDAGEKRKIVGLLSSRQAMPQVVPTLEKRIHKPYEEILEESIPVGRCSGWGRATSSKVDIQLVFVKVRRTAPPFYSTGWKASHTLLECQ
jgi:hypothetical protein